MAAPECMKLCCDLWCDRCCACLWPVPQLEQELSNPASSLTAAGAYDDVVEVLHNPGIR
jgi:hypothetical protein